MGLRVLYYIAPQTWASRRGRNRALAKCVDQVACILPFEESFFRAAGVPAEYVGHPLFESLAAERPDPAVVERLRGPGRPVIAILPGSRRHVIDTMLPLQLEVMRRVSAMIGGNNPPRKSPGSSAEPRRRFENTAEGGRATLLRRAAKEGAGVANLVVGVSCASPDHYEQIRGHVAAAGVEASIVVADTAGLLTACDLALVTSGTATLTAGYYRKPVVVMYDAGGPFGPLYEAFGRRVVKTPHLSLLNILAGRRIVPEFMPFVPDVEPVARVVRDLLCDESWRRLMIRQIDETIAPLEASRASENVCQMIRRLLSG
jgi:lipid-A-disaccharide synthase